LEGVQVIITTHSPAFVSLLDLEGIALTRKAEGGGTVVTQLTETDLSTACLSTGAAQATPETVLPFYEVAATDEIRAGFFARKIILVEGPTEAEALPIYLTRVGLDVVREGIALIPVFGVGNLAKWLRFFGAYKIPTYVVFDNDAAEDADANRRTDLFEALQLPLERRDELLEASSLVVQPTAAAFGVNFESTLADLFGTSYEAMSTDAADTYKLSREGSKPLVGRYVAEHIDPARESSAWALIGDLAEAIRGLVLNGAPQVADDEIPF
jgi:putative ATP-dependent endonuclease of OLD family